MQNGLMQKIITVAVIVLLVGFAVGYGNKTRDKVYTAEMMQAVLTVDNAITFQTANGELFTAKGQAEVGKWYAVVLKDNKCTDDIGDDEVVSFTEVDNETVRTVRRDNVIQVNRLIVKGRSK